MIDVGNETTIFRSFSSQCRLPGEGGGEGGGVGQRLVDDAEAFGELEQGGELVLGGVGVEVEAETDSAEADPGFLAHTEGAPEVEVTFGVDGAAPDGDVE